MTNHQGCLHAVGDYFQRLHGEDVAGTMPDESTWARIQQEELDKVHAIWCKSDRRS